MSACPRGLPRKAGSGIFVSPVHVLASCSGRGSQKLACRPSTWEFRRAGAGGAHPGKARAEPREVQGCWSVDSFSRHAFIAGSGDGP